MNIGIIIFLILMNPLCYYVTNTYDNFWFKIANFPHTLFTTYLCWKYPFLKFDHSYDYEEDDENDFLEDLSWYDIIPRGWRKAFGLKMIKELNKVCKKDNVNIVIYDIKEKWGYLHFYYSGGNKKTDEIIDKYEDLSYKTCIVCGKKAKYISGGWICPYCEKHIGNKTIIEILK